MANKKTLKGYFETGDIPNQSQYHELINSNLNLNETGTQILVGTLSSSFLEVENHITASGNISASGTNHILGGDLTIGDDFTFGIHQLSTHASGSFVLTSGSTTILSAQGTHITASGNISASGAITQANGLVAGIGNGAGRLYFGEFGGSNIHLLKVGNNLALANGGLTTSEITASGEISSSGNNYASAYHTDNYLSLNTNGTQGRVFSDASITGIQIGRNGTTNKNIELLGPVTASGNISSSGNILANGATIVEQLDMTSDQDSIFNMYMDGNLNTSFHSRGNINSFVEAGTSVANFGVGTITPAEKLTVHGNISGSGNLKIDGSQVDFTNLPTSDPSVAGRLYREGTDLKISLG